MKTILGIDPGYGRTGYGAITINGPVMQLLETGCVETPSVDAFDARLRATYDGVCELLRRFHPTLVGIEHIFFSKNVKTAIQVAHARGVIVLACAQSKIPTISITPNEVKLAVAGYGSATKQQVQRMTVQLLNLPSTPSPDDAADAVAIAIAVSPRANAQDAVRILPRRTM